MLRALLPGRSPYFYQNLAGNPVMLDHPSHLTTAYRVLLELPADYQR